jgi:hypothetical protein
VTSGWEITAEIDDERDRRGNDVEVWVTTVEAFEWPL